MRRCWYITVLISIVALINYFDRQSLSFLAPRFQQQLHLSDVDYGHIVSLFLLASAISYLLAGFIADWLGTKTSMVLFVGWWSAAEAATAFVGSGIQLALARFCLGLGESGLWVVAPKAVGEILPRKNQSVAIGIYTFGSTIGAVAALPVIAALAAHFPWKWVFLIDGSCGLLWVPFWLYAYPTKKRPAARTLESTASSPSQFALLRNVLAQSKTWRLMLARGITDPVWYFFLFWFPKYLLSARGLPVNQVARIGWLVYLFAGAGTLLGGIISAWQIRNGTTVGFAYRRTMLFCALLLPLSPLIGLLPNSLFAVGIASLITLAHMAWLVTLSSAVVNLFPANELGKAFGLIAAGSGFGGMLSSECIGYIVTHHGYVPIFFLMMFLHPLALFLLWKTFLQRDTT